MDINFEYYKIFYYVAKYCNFTKAARALGNSQPNVTRAMNNLEQQINSILFIRNNRGVQLTPEGERLYAHVSAAMSQILAAEEELSDSTGLSHGSVSIGASETALNIYLLDRLKPFHMARSPPPSTPCSARRSLRPAATSTSSRTTIPKISRSSWAIAAASSRSCSTSSAMPSSTRPTAATSVSPRAARAKLSGWRSRTTASAFPRPTAAAFSSASTASTKQDRANPAAQASAFPSRRRSSSVTTARSRSLTAPAPARPSA